MSGSLLRLLVASVLLASSLLSVARAAAVTAQTLPIIFFHGVTSSAKAGYNLQQQLQTGSRPFVALNFCESECSIRDLPTQVTMAIAQIRSVTKNDSRFDSGYVVIAHSQGGILARAVLEEMDDHKAHTFISLAGAQNGNFYGPQASDKTPTQVFLKSLGPKVIPATLFNFANYTDTQIASGALQVDFIKLINSQPSLQEKLSTANLLRSPVQSDWIRVNKFLPVVNNMAGSAADRARRKRNFLKLKAAHFFASSSDETISPWQTSIFGQYENVSSMKQLAQKFSKLEILPMTQTTEYKSDTYGLRTLDKRGGLHLHPVDGVSHSCWVADSTPVGSTKVCKFQPVFDKYLSPLLSPSAKNDSPVQGVKADVRQSE